MRMAGLLWMALVATAAAGEIETGPWDLAALRRAPEVEWVKKEGMLRSLYYAGEPLGGKPTRVFAYYGVPEKGAPLGTAQLERLAGPSPLPVVALGGIDPTNVAETRDTGVAGIAVIRALRDSDDPVAAARALSGTVTPR